MALATSTGRARMYRLPACSSAIAFAVGRQDDACSSSRAHPGFAPIPRRLSGLLATARRVSRGAVRCRGFARLNVSVGPVMVLAFKIAPHYRANARATTGSLHRQQFPFFRRSSEHNGNGPRGFASRDAVQPSRHDSIREAPVAVHEGQDDRGRRSSSVTSAARSMPVGHSRSCSQSMVLAKAVDHPALAGSMHRPRALALNVACRATNPGVAALSGRPGADLRHPCAGPSEWRICGARWRGFERGRAEMHERSRSQPRDIRADDVSERSRASARREAPCAPGWKHQSG